MSGSSRLDLHDPLLVSHRTLEGGATRRDGGLCREKEKGRERRQLACAYDQVREGMVPRRQELKQLRSFSHSSPEPQSWRISSRLKGSACSRQQPLRATPEMSRYQDRPRPIISHSFVNRIASGLPDAKRHKPLSHFHRRAIAALQNEIAMSCTSISRPL